MTSTAHQLRLRARAAAVSSFASAESSGAASERGAIPFAANQAARLWQVSTRFASLATVKRASCTADVMPMYRDSKGIRGPAQGLQGFEGHRRSGFPPE